MFCVRIVPEGMEILNQHWTVKAALPEFQLNVPLGSGTVKSALPGNVAATEEKFTAANNKPMKNPATDFAKVFCLAGVFIVSTIFSHLFYVVASQYTISVSLAHQHDFRADSCAFHFESDAIIWIHICLFAPSRGFVGKDFL